VPHQPPFKFADPFVAPPLAAAGSNATYSFLIEEADADEFDLVLALHTQSGDADL
jgi:hypothetical protein